MKNKTTTDAIRSLINERLAAHHRAEEDSLKDAADALTAIVISHIEAELESLLDEGDPLGDGPFDGEARDALRAAKRRFPGFYRQVMAEFVRGIGLRPSLPSTMFTMVNQWTEEHPTEYGNMEKAWKDSNFETKKAFSEFDRQMDAGQLADLNEQMAKMSSLVRQNAATFFVALMSLIKTWIEIDEQADATLTEIEEKLNAKA
jgi:hypothetical protein